ncbi:MAG: LamG domain-containing protein [Spirochaetales bacterium]|nr:LamG domain-containing protein [Spirochaetales bacterium]
MNHSRLPYIIPVMGIGNGQIKHEIWDSANTRFAVDIGDVHPGIWSHIVLTWKTGGKMRSYIDGILTREIDTGSNPMGIAVCRLPLRIGCAPRDIDYAGFNGNIDDLRLYEEELGASEILALYHYLPY